MIRFFFLNINIYLQMEEKLIFLSLSLFFSILFSKFSKAYILRFFSIISYKDKYMHVSLEVCICQLYDATICKAM